jgi:hypothetical protein
MPYSIYVIHFYLSGEGITGIVFFREQAALYRDGEMSLSEKNRDNRENPIK